MCWLSCMMRYELVRHSDLCSMEAHSISACVDCLLLVSLQDDAQANDHAPQGPLQPSLHPPLWPDQQQQQQQSDVKAAGLPPGTTGQRARAGVSSKPPVEPSAGGHLPKAPGNGFHSSQHSGLSLPKLKQSSSPASRSKVLQAQHEQAGLQDLQQTFPDEPSSLDMGKPPDIFTIKGKTYRRLKDLNHGGSAQVYAVS